MEFAGDYEIHLPLADLQEWEHFVLDCPWVEGGPGEWLDRFEAAMAPAFARR